MELHLLKMVLEQTSGAIAPIVLFLYFYLKGKKEEKNVVTSYKVMSKNSRESFKNLELKLLTPVNKLNSKMDSIDCSVNELSVVVRNLVKVSDMETEAFLYKTRLQETVKVKLSKLEGDATIKTFLEFKSRVVIDLSHSVSMAISKSIHIDNNMADIANSVKSEGTIAVEEVNARAKELFDYYFISSFYNVHEPQGRNYIVSLKDIAIDNENNKMSRINTLTVNFILNFIDSVNLLYYKYLADKKQFKNIGVLNDKERVKKSKTSSEIFRDNLSRG